MNPVSVSNQQKTNDALNEVKAQYRDVYRDDGHRGIVSKNIGGRNGAYPDKNRIEQKGNPGFATGTQGEIGGVHVGVNRHIACTDQNQSGGGVFDLRCCIVYLWKKQRSQR